MPPKAARGAARGRGEARGRGRGRGRGGRAPVAPAADASSAPEVKEQEAGSQSTIVDSPMPDAEPAASTTPVHEQEQNDPNSSPATQPTETPAPTPVRLPPVASDTNGSAASGLGTKGTGAAKSSKFKPRIIRANAKEREEREARERARENDRLGAVAAATARENRIWGRGRGGRGRGDAMGRGRGVHTSGAASGPFAVAPAGAENKGFFAGGGGVKREPGAGYSRGGGSGGGGASGPTIKTEGGTYTVGALGGSHDPVAGRFMPDPQYPGEEDDDAPRIDIEHINLASDDDDEDVVMTGVGRSNKGKGKVVSNKGGLKPIRLDRKEHKERVTIVNTENTVKSAPEDDNDPDVMIVDEGRSSKAALQKRPWTGTYGDDVKIKTEPGIIPSIEYASAPTASSPPPSDFKAPDEVGDDDLEFEMELTRPEPSSPRTERRIKPRIPAKRKEVMPVIQTEEDRAEWERHVEDLDILRKELTGLTTHLDPRNKGKVVEGDVGMGIEGAAAQEHASEMKEDGRIYLFQFPPVLPKLFNEMTSSNPNDIKHGDDVEVMETVDLTKDKNLEVKSEEKVVEIKQEELDADEELKRKEREALVVEEGLIGRLIVRESGQVELVWGGTNMKVSRGVETSFFSAGAVVDGMDQWIKDEKGNEFPVIQGSRGRSLSMGMIMGKFVVTPDWTNIH